MAEIHVEKKPRSGWAWVWVLLLLGAIGLIAWLYWPDRVRTEPTATATMTDPAMGGDPSVVDTVPLPDVTQSPQSPAMISEIRANPGQWVGREFLGVVNVIEGDTTDDTAMPPERGFWIEQDGQRLFVLVNDDPNNMPAAVTPGQPIRIRGMVRDATFIPQLGAMNLSGEADELLRKEPAYLVAEESAIELALDQTQIPIQTQAEQPPAATP